MRTPTPLHALPLLALLLASCEDSTDPEVPVRGVDAGADDVAVDAADVDAPPPPQEGAIVVHLGEAPPGVLEVELEYEMVGGGYGGCETAGVNGAFGWILSNGAGGTVDELYAQPCAELVQFEGLPSDVYVLDVGADSQAGVNWGDYCNQLDITNVGARYRCSVPFRDF